MNIQIHGYRPDADQQDRALVFVRLAASEEGTDGGEGASAATTSNRRPPAHISLALDISSSMGGQPLMAAVDAIATLVSHLDTDDRIGLVVFDRSARVIAAPQEMTETAKNDLLHKLDALRPGIGTNLADGYRLAGEQLLTAFVPGGQPRILLLTDGYPSVGPSTPAYFHQAARDLLGRGVATSTIGFGLRYDDALMEGVARAGDGAYHFVAHPADLVDVFSSELRAAHEIEVTDALVKVIPSDSVKGVELLHRYPTRMEPDGLVVEVGSVGRLGPRKLLFALKASEIDLGRIRVSWSPVEGEPLGGLVLPLSVGSSEVDAELDREARREYAMLMLAQEERQAWDALLRGHPRTARGHVDAAQAAVGKMLTSGLASSKEAQMHRIRLDDAQQVLDGRLEREAAFLLSQAFTARISTSMVMSRNPELAGVDGRRADGRENTEEPWAPREARPDVVPDPESDPSGEID